MEQQMEEMYDAPEVNPEGFFNDLTSQNACSVRVAVRVRPMIGRELNEGGGPRTCVEVFDSENKINIGEKQFQFDRVFSSDSEQQELFDVCARNLVLGCFAGYNATILAYGQTGSGKTHTMGTGSTNGLSSDQIGIVPRVFEFIFEELDRKKKESQFSEFTIKISFLELYNEELHDLLDPNSIGQVDRITGKPMKELFIKEKNGAINVQGLSEEIVDSAHHCLQLLNKGISHRTTSATLMNEGSSRSHAIFTIAIEQKIVKEIDVPAAPDGKEGGVPGQQEEQITAKFHFVDLAGSERIKRTGATGQLMKEGISINKGLLCLGNVISALTDEGKKDKHIPYRDSKLTRILQDSLGGNSRTTMIACVSPAESSYEETLNSIKYASRARNIKNKAVVNRDANSMLIDQLRGQISKLQGEVKEYSKILKENGIPIPANMEEAIQKSMDEQRKQQPRMHAPSHTQSSGGDGSLISATGSINFGELRDVKIKLSRKEKELKEAQELLQQIQEKMALKDSVMDDLQRERDTLRLKNEILNEHLTRNNLQLDDSQTSSQSLSLIDEYKQKLEKMQKDIDKKNAELQAKSKQIGELQAKKQIDDQLLNKHIEEIKRLKGQLRKYEEGGVSSATIQQSPAGKRALDSRFKLNLQGITGASSGTQQQMEGKKLNLNIDAEGLNKKYIDNLSIQLDSIFGASALATDEDGGLMFPGPPLKSPAKHRPDLLHLQFPSSSDDEQLLTSTVQDLDDPTVRDPAAIEEKEKILSTIKSSVQQMQSELVEMMKNKYESQISQIERDMKQVDSEKQATLKKTTDTKQAQAIEIQYKQKMDDLQKQLATFKEKEKQQELKQKQISVQENKIKSLEDDIGKIKKNKENLEKQMKSETEKFSKLKQNYQKELISAKKAKTEKEQEVQKLKHDLKKTDQLAQQKISELRGFQKKIYEERLRRDLEKQQDHDKKGIDIDRIKTWITQNTDKMIMHQELKDAIEKHNSEKERIEEEIITEGDKLSQLMLSKDRLELEKQQLEMAEEVDEGRILEMEEEIYQFSYQINNLNEQLDTLEASYNRHLTVLNQLNEELIGLDVDNIEPLKFSGLQSVDAAKVTLQTFFSVMLDLNIYKRDLENKCIESDETILELNSQIAQLNQQIEDVNSKSQQNMLSGSTDVSSMGFGGMNAKNLVQKEKAIKNIVNTLEGFVDYQEVKNLHLTPNEQNSLTKLSLSKIVSNLKSQLEEEKKKNHNLVLKLEQAIKDKENFRLKFDNLRKKNTDDAIVRDPMQLQNKDGAQSAEPQRVQAPSLSERRATRRKGPEAASANPEAKGKPRMHQQKSSLDELQAQSEQMQGKSLKFSQAAANGRFGSNKKPASFMIKNQQHLDSDDSQSREDSETQSKPKVPNFMTSTKSSQNQVSNLQKRQPAFRKKADEVQQVQILNQQETVFEQSQQLKVVPSLKDRRNQRKIGNDQQKMESDRFNEEIDKIKEETSQMTNNQQHLERRQFRENALQKKINKDRGVSGSQNRQSSNDEEQPQNAGNKYIDMMGNVKEMEEVEGEDSPMAMNHRNRDGFEGIPEEGDYYQEGDLSAIQFEGAGNQTFMTTQPQNMLDELRTHWTHEELVFLENHKAKLIGATCFEGKAVLVFEDFTIREISIETIQESTPFNVLAANRISQDPYELAIDIAVEKELQAIAITSQANVYIFDFGYRFITKIELQNIEKIAFCQLFMILQVNVDDATCFISYQIEDGSEQAMYEIKSEGQKPLLKSDDNFIYIACGIRLAKLKMPEMEPVFVIETEHQDAIIDFTISDQTIITTSVDRSVRVHNKENGEQCVNSIDDIECDTLESTEDFVIMRVFDGAQFLVWRYYNSSEDLEFIDEINQTEEREQMGEIAQFLMRGKFNARFSKNGPNYDVVLLVTVIKEGIILNVLKHKPLSEM